MKVFSQFVVAALAAVPAMANYDTYQASISLNLSQAAACGHEEYLTHEYIGAAKGFVATKALFNQQTDTSGFIGFLPSEHAIYVVFRGSEDVKNWITNLDALHTDYVDDGCKDCTVHKGFYSAEQSVLIPLMIEVGELSSKYATS